MSQKTKTAWETAQPSKKLINYIHVPKYKKIGGVVVDVGESKPISQLTEQDKTDVAQQHADYLNDLPLCILQKLKPMIFFMSLLLLIFCSFDNMSTRGYILTHCGDKESIYLNKIWDDAEKVAKSNQIPLALVLAQSCLESGFGRSNLAVNNCNHHGIKYCGKYAEFSCKLESFEAYAKTLSKECYGKPKNLGEWFVALECCNYAMSKSYVSKLKIIIKRLNLYLIQ